MLKQSVSLWKKLGSGCVLSLKNWTSFENKFASTAGVGSAGTASFELVNGLFSSCAFRNSLTRGFSFGLPWHFFPGRYQKILASHTFVANENKWVIMGLCATQPKPWIGWRRSRATDWRIFAQEEFIGVKSLALPSVLANIRFVIWKIWRKSEEKVEKIWRQSGASCENQSVILWKSECDFGKVGVWFWQSRSVILWKSASDVVKIRQWCCENRSVILVKSECDFDKVGVWFCENQPVMLWKSGSDFVKIGVWFW